MFSNKSRSLAIGFAGAVLAACGGGGSTGGSMNPPPSAPQSANVAMLVSDASTEDWATIGVKVLSIALVPQGGGSNVTVYTAPTPAPVVNLAELDQIAEILGNVSVPVGTYTGAVLTVSGNSGDVLLTTSADPEAGFAAAASTTIPAADIQIQHTSGTAANLTVPVSCQFRFTAGRDARIRTMRWILNSTWPTRRSSSGTCRRARARRCGRSTSMGRCVITRCTIWRAWYCATCTAM